MEKIKLLWAEKPLLIIIWLAIIFRFIAIIFAKGFGMHDDHFLVIEVSQSWIDGVNFNHWLPGSDANAQPSGHSFFYTGLSYFLFYLLHLLQINDPQTKMFVVRFIHAAFSLITVYYGYKIVEKIDNKSSAKIVGILLAIYWIMPWLSVRNLVEVVCIPFLILGIWFIVNSEQKKNIMLAYFLSGIFFGLAFSVRFQTLFFTAGVGLALLLLKRWKASVYFLLGLIPCICIIQCGSDYYFWGYPFAELGEYIRYNVENAYNYLTSSWYTYILLLLGILIPPISFFLFFGFFRTWKKHLLLFLPTLIFLVFHSYFPNKQERFIIPIFPFIIMLGVIGWNDFVVKSKFWQNHKQWLRGSWIFFWVINIILLFFVSTMYSKRSRVESMVYLSKYKNIHNILIEDSNHGRSKRPPQFYLGQWVKVREYANSKEYSPLSKVYAGAQKSDYPDFILLFGDKNLEKRIDSIKTIAPHIQYETTIRPGLIDIVLFKMNPINSNQTIYIYRNTDFFPTKLN